MLPIGRSTVSQRWCTAPRRRNVGQRRRPTTLWRTTKILVTTGPPAWQQVGAAVPVGGIVAEGRTSITAPQERGRTRPPHVLEGAETFSSRMCGRPRRLTACPRGSARHRRTARAKACVSCRLAVARVGRGRLVEHGDTVTGCIHV